MSHQPEKAAGPFALCLSGGGFRATFFHLGVLRFLWEARERAEHSQRDGESARLLERVTDVFAVSGGSILAAHLATYWDEYMADFDKPARRLVRFGQSDVIGKIFLRPWPSNLLRGTPALERLYARQLLPKGGFVGFRTSPVNLEALGPAVNKPRFFLLATNLTTGGPLWFTAGALVSPDPEGHQVEVDIDNATPVESFLLARALAASSAFPPVFAPVRLRPSDAVSPRGKFLVETSLADGGVFDNIGLNSALRVHSARSKATAGTAQGNPAWLSHAGPFARIVVSDGGAAFRWSLRGTYWFIRRATRTTDILMHRVSLLEPERTGDFGVMRAEITKVQIGDELGKLRTNLDAFSDEEIRLLVWRGYFTAARQLSHQVRADGPLWDPCPPRRLFPPRIPQPPALDPTKAIEQLDRRAQALTASEPPPETFLGAARAKLDRWLRPSLHFARRCLLYHPVLWVPVVLGVGALFFLHWLGASGAPEAFAVPASAEATISTETVTLSPDGESVVFSATSATDGSKRLYISRTGGQPRPVDGSKNGSSPFFSKDYEKGQYVAFIANDALYVSPVSGGDAIRVAQDPGFRLVQSGAWLGQQIVLSEPRALRRCAIEGGGLSCRLKETISSRQNESFCCATFASKRETVYVSTVAGESQIRLAETDARLIQDASRPRVVGSEELLFERKGEWRVSRIALEAGLLRADVEGRPALQNLRGNCRVLDISVSGMVACENLDKRAHVLIRVEAPKPRSIVRVEEVHETTTLLEKPRFGGSRDVILVDDGDRTLCSRRNTSSGKWSPLSKIGSAECPSSLDPYRSGSSTMEEKNKGGERSAEVKPKGVISPEMERAEPVWRNEEGHKDEFYFRAGPVLSWARRGTKQGVKMDLDPLTWNETKYFIVASKDGAANYDHYSGYFAMVARRGTHRSEVRVIAGGLSDSGFWRQCVRGMRLACRWFVSRWSEPARGEPRVS